MSKVNIFGKVQEALEQALDGNAENFTFENVDKVEATAINALFIMTFTNVIRNIHAEGQQGQQNREFFKDLFSAQMDDVAKPFSPERMISYHEDSKTLILSPPAERVESMLEVLKISHMQLGSIRKSSKGRVDLPNQGSPICYMVAVGDQTGVIDNETFAISFYKLVSALAEAHGFEDAAAIDIKQSPPMVGIKVTALDAIMRGEKLDLPRSGDGPSSISI